MYAIRLVNMPFANLHIPSIGLTQLSSAVRRQHGQRASVKIHYLNHYFAHFLTLDLYRNLSALGEHQNSGIGDWFFRQVAFPDEYDNFDEFFLRYYQGTAAEAVRFRSVIAERRRELVSFLDHLIDSHGLARADLVGLTSMFAQNVACFALARRIKDSSQRTVVVMGGANCETPMGQEIMRKVPQIDFVFSGPALRSFPDLVGRLMDGDDAGTHRIHGVFSKRNVDSVMPIGRKDQRAPGNVVTLPPPGVTLPIGQDLDIDADIDLDFDSFLDDVARNFPAGQVTPVLPFETSRGCWWGERAHCTFCGLNGLTMNYRAMSAEKALVLLRSMFQQYGSRCRH